MKRLASALALMACSVTAFAESTVTVNITQVNSGDGQLVVSVYDTKKSWLKEPMLQETVTAADGASVEFLLPDGEYAVHVFHDLDSNGKMKTNFIGIPREPTGVSNEAKGKFGPPKFKDAKFAVTGEPVDVPIRMVEI